MWRDSFSLPAVSLVNPEDPTRSRGVSYDTGTDSLFRLERRTSQLRRTAEGFYEYQETFSQNPLFRVRTGEDGLETGKEDQIQEEKDDVEHLPQPQQREAESNYRQRVWHEPRERSLSSRLGLTRKSRTASKEARSEYSVDEQSSPSAREHRKRKGYRSRFNTLIHL